MSDSHPRLSNVSSEVRDALAGVLAEAFPFMLRDFLYSDDARDVTGKWGFTTTMGDQFREELIEAAGGDHAGF